jgi:hypothetical protein
LITPGNTLEVKDGRVNADKARQAAEAIVNAEANGIGGD